MYTTNLKFYYMNVINVLHLRICLYAKLNVMIIYVCMSFLYVSVKIVFFYDVYSNQSFIIVYPQAIR